jgi:predicted DNA-binding protein YlxM (UPF0122 family)
MSIKSNKSRKIKERLISMNDEYSNLFSKQQEFRNKLTEIAIKKKMSFRAIAYGVGVSPSTMCDFIKKQRDISFKALTKVKDYCDKEYEPEKVDLIF